ncbi:MAG TPA: OB-fold nucleic acid binding domain-containing protein [Bryocella sp.]|nr:OB-fold nucleic acid binding domain-containing protein [Bryocella sp.]
MNLVRWSKVLGTAALLILATQTIIATQKVANTGPKYDVANEVKIKGVVEDIREVPGAFEGTHLVVKTDTGTVLVRVAPADFLKEMDTSFKVGDVVEVTGAKAPDAAEPEILAREITVGTNTTTLRDDKGIPVWAGWKPAKSN